MLSRMISLVFLGKSFDVFFFAICYSFGLSEGIGLLRFIEGFITSLTLNLISFTDQTTDFSVILFNQFYFMTC